MAKEKGITVDELMVQMEEELAKKSRRTRYYR
jgi:hypothetical protein